MFEFSYSGSQSYILFNPLFRKKLCWLTIIILLQTHALNTHSHIANVLVLGIILLLIVLIEFIFYVVNGIGSAIT